MKEATLKFIGTQDGGDMFPSFDLFNIIALSEPDDENKGPGPALVVGSTVTTASVWRRGYWPNVTTDVS